MGFNGSLQQWGVIDYDSLITGIMLILSSIGLLGLKRWGAIISVIFVPAVVGVWILFPLWLFISTIVPSNLFNIFWIPSLEIFARIILLVVISYLIYIFYFTRPKVKALFSPERTNGESKEAV